MSVFVTISAIEKHFWAANERFLHHQNITKQSAIKNRHDTLVALLPVNRKLHTFTAAAITALPFFFELCTACCFVYALPLLLLMTMMMMMMLAFIPFPPICFLLLFVRLFLCRIIFNKQG